MNYDLNSVDISLVVQIVNDNGLPVTGLNAAAFPTITLARSNSSQVLSLSDLAAIDSAHTAGGVWEISGGRYRLDLPDSVFLSAGPLAVIGEVTGKRVLHPVVNVTADLLDTSEDPDTTQDIGVKTEDSIVRLDFQERNAEGVVNPDVVTVTVYKDDLSTEIPDTTGISIVNPFASNVGAVRIRLDTSNDTGKANYWADGSSYLVKVTTVLQSDVYGVADQTKVRWFRFTLSAATVAVEDHAQPEFDWNLSSETGDVLEVAAWLDINGQTVDIDALDAAATCSIIIREFSAAIGAPLLTFNLTANVAAEYEDKRFQKEYTNPSAGSPILAASSEYDIEVIITVNGVTYERNFSRKTF